MCEPSYNCLLAEEGKSEKIQLGLFSFLNCLILCPYSLHFYFCFVVFSFPSLPSPCLFLYFTKHNYSLLLSYMVIFYSVQFILRFIHVWLAFSCSSASCICQHYVLFKILIFNIKFFSLETQLQSWLLWGWDHRYNLQNLQGLSMGGLDRTKCCGTLDLGHSPVCMPTLPGWYISPNFIDFWYRHHMDAFLWDCIEASRQFIVSIQSMD